MARHRWNTKWAKVLIGVLVLGAMYLAYQYTGQGSLPGSRRAQGPVGYGWGSSPYSGGSVGGNPTKLRELSGACSCH